jgi:hypothetical protein
MVVDRGASNYNANDGAGAARSNVRWTWYNNGFIGDDFTIGAPGEHWAIDAIRTWTVPGDTTCPAALGDLYQDVRLYFGGSAGDLTPILSGRFQPGASQPDNPAISITDATANGLLEYENFGSLLRVWQIDFKPAGLVVDGGAKYRFGVWGLGRPTGEADRAYSWFNLAANAGLSGVGAASADNRLLKFDAAGAYQGSFDANGSGWDKSADIDVQVFAHKVRGGMGRVTAIQ